MASGNQSLEAYPMYIGGEWVATSEQTEVRLPYDGSPAGRVYQAGPELVDRAVAAAGAASAKMRALANYERADLLLRLVELVRRDLADFARLIASETGKPIREARLEVERGIQTLIASAEAARSLCGEVVPMDAAPAGKGRMALTVREPRGVVAAITPFNFPFNLALHKIGPALGAGNAVVHKPAGVTPLSALRLARAMEEAGAPPGAYNVVTGPGSLTGEALVRHSGVNMVTFTGSAEIGLAIKVAAGLKHVTLELGGNSAVIIEPDADLENAVARSVVGAFANSGQVCISVQRIYVHESVAAKFLESFVAATERLVIGRPFDESTDISSLITEKEAVRVEQWIEEAIAAGAQLLTGGRRTGATVSPAILAEAGEQLRVCCQEVFGPVVVVNRYRMLEEAIERVNNSVYGLQAGVFTRDLERAFRAARRLEVGGVIINDVPTFRADHMPYGGVKQSGTGREGPKYAIEEMTELKLICWKV